MRQYILIVYNYGETHYYGPFSDYAAAKQWAADHVAYDGARYEAAPIITPIGPTDKTE